MWTVDSTRGVAARVDLTFGKLVAPAGVRDQPGLSTNPNPLAVSGGVAWVANDVSQVVRIPGNGPVSRIDVGNGPSGIAIGEGATWVADAADDTVSRINAAGRVLRVIPVGPGASGIAVGGGAVWVADTLADSSWCGSILSTRLGHTTIAVGSRPSGVACGDGSVWVANSGDGTVSRIDPRTDRVAATIRVGQSPQELVVTAGAVWVSVAASPPIQVASGSPPGVLRVVRG